MGRSFCQCEIKTNDKCEVTAIAKIILQEVNKCDNVYICNENLPSKSASPTPTIIIDKGNLDACKMKCFI